MPIASVHRSYTCKFTLHVVHGVCALSNKMNSNRNMAIATALRGFNDLGHSVTPTFLSRNRFYLTVLNCSYSS